MPPPGNVEAAFREALGTVELLIKTADARHFSEYDAMRLEQCAFMVRSMLGLPEKPKAVDLRHAAAKVAEPSRPQPARTRTLGRILARWTPAPASRGKQERRQR
jgi:hypothetical protein